MWLLWPLVRRQWALGPAAALVAGLLSVAAPARLRRGPLPRRRLLVADLLWLLLLGVVALLLHMLLLLCGARGCSGADHQA